MLLSLCMNNGASMDGVPRGGDGAAPAQVIRRPLMGLGLSVMLALLNKVLLNG